MPRWSATTAIEVLQAGFVEIEPTEQARASLTASALKHVLRPARAASAVRNFPGQRSQVGASGPFRT
jgi:hypothetical protein